MSKLTFTFGALVFVGMLVGCTAPASGPVEDVAISSPSPEAPSPTPEPSTPPAPDGTRDLPWPVGTSAKYDETSVWTYSVGATAIDQWQAIVAVNEYSQPPANGNMYITAPVTLAVDETEQTAAGVDPSASLSFSYVTASGTSGKDCFVQLPSPGDLYEVGIVFGGATVQFLACAEVPIADVVGGTWSVRSLVDPTMVTFFEGAK